MRRTLLACAALAFLDLACFGRFTFDLGFYHDDWQFLEAAALTGGFAETVGRMSAEFVARPTLGLLYASLLRLLGETPAPYHAGLAALRVLESVLFMLLARRLTGSRALAVLAAAFAAAYPCRFGDRVWFSNVAQMLAQCLALGALILHVDWLGSGDRRRAVLAQVLAVVAALTYESVLFLPLAAALPRWRACIGRGAESGPAAARTFGEFAPFSVPLAAYVAWRTLGLPMLGAEGAKSAAPSAGWALDVFARGAWHVLAKPFVFAAQGLQTGSGWNAVWGLALAGLALAAWTARPRGSRAAGGAALWAALGFFLGGYLPYALSGTYIPAATGVMSRVNGAAAFPFGLLLAVAAVSLGRRGLVAAVLFALVQADGVLARDWAESWRAQRAILAAARAHEPEFPRGAAVWLADAPVMVGGVLVFSANWDFGPALRRELGRTDLAGRVASFSGGDVYQEAMASDQGRHRCFFSFARNGVVCRPPGPG